MPTIKELYDHITSQLTPEEALMNLLKNSVIQYEAQKLDPQGEPVHPLYIITLAAMEMGWAIAFDSTADEVNGISVGTQEYMDTLFKKDEGLTSDAD